MVNQFAPVGGSQSLLYFAEESLVVIDEPLDRLLHERLCVPTAFSSKASQFCLQISANIHFHALKPRVRGNPCQRQRQE